MAMINDGGPAFPRGAGSYGGMSLRAYAAVAAMQGLRANHLVEFGHEEMARYAIKDADALIAELEKTP